MMFGVITSDGDIIPTFMFHMASNSIQKPTWSGVLDQEGGSCKIMSGNKTSHHATQVGEPSIGCQKISATTSSLRFDYLSTQIAISFIMWGAVEQETIKTSCNTKDELKARTTEAFTNLNEETVRKACKRFQSCLQVMVEANINSFE